MASSIASGSIPVTTIGGYLGSGKTTLLNHLLSDAHGMRLAVLVNDFGDVSIDSRLIAARDSDIITLANGCACCSVAGDLGEALDRLARLDPPPQHVLIEASGIADPARIAAMANSPGLRPYGTVVLADAETVRARAADKFVGRLVRDQLLRADLIVLSKTDLVETETLAAVKDWMGGIVPGTCVVETAHGQLPLDVLLETPAIGIHQVPTRLVPHPAFESHLWVSHDTVDIARLVDVVADLPATIVRVKGVVAAPNDGSDAWVLQRAGQRVAVTPFNGRANRTEIVVIAIAGRLEAGRLDERFAGCVTACEFSHD